MTLTKAAWHHIRRSPFQSLTAILVMFISFFTLSCFAIVSHGLSGVLDFFETKPEITIFLKDGLDRQTVAGIQKELSTYQNIRQIKFISKEKALESYQEQNKDNPLLTEMVTASILPASFEISVTDPSVLEQIDQNFSTKTDLVDEIIYQKDVIDSLLNWTNIIRKIGLVIVTVISLASFFVILIIIGMKITGRKGEIRVSRLLGASRLYVQKSFLLEGLFYGLFGSLIAAITSFALAFYLAADINRFVQPVTFIDPASSFYPLLFLVLVSAGLFLGLLASWFGVRRFIKF